MRRRRAGIEAEGLAGQGARLGRAPHRHVKTRAKSERLRLRQGAGRPDALLHLHPGHPPPGAEDRTPYVGLELPVEGLGVAEGLPRGPRGGPPGLEQGREAVDLAPALVGPRTR